MGQRKRTPSKKGAARQRQKKRLQLKLKGAKKVNVRKSGSGLQTPGGATKLAAPDGGWYTSRYVGVGW